MLGITPDTNSIALWQFDVAANDNVLKPRPVFTEVKQGIDILVYTLDRLPVRIEKSGSKQKTDYSIIRYETPVVKPNGDVMKYQMPKGHPTQPFFPPELLAAYDAKQPIPVLYITEGYFKAWKGCMHGIMTVGVPSITCLKDKNTGKLFGDIVKLIQTCKVQRLVWLVDGDCRDLTSKDITDGIDLYTRPANFYRTVATFADLTSNLEQTERYFAYINSADIEGKPKGLDDLLIMYPATADDIKADAYSFDRIQAAEHVSDFFVKMNISHSVGKVHRHFNLNNVDNFYLYYVDKRPEIKNVKFKFNGTLYKYNDDEKVQKCEIVIPKEAGNYARVGDHYYEHIEVPDKYNNLQKRWVRREKTTITDDHKKDILKHIPKYNDFCTVPSHDDYQRIINNCFNAYHPFEHEPEEGEYETTLNFFKHIFGTQDVKTVRDDGTEVVIKGYELGLDYFTILYKHPQQILPILCLASSANNTGKSTFIKFLKHVFGQNAAIVSNEDLASGFNSHWVSKLLVMCEETKIDKDIVVEKVKALSTGTKIMMNAKGRDQVEVDFFAKFIFATNNEDNFLPITEKDVRYWVIKVPTLANLILDMDEILREELPAFLHFINTREMATQNQYRHWFKPEYLRTEALENVIKNSQPNIIKRLYGQLERLFHTCDDSVTEIHMPAQDIADMLGRKDDAEYIKRELKKMGYRTMASKRGNYPVIEMRADAKGHQEPYIITKTFHTTYYVFEREKICPGTGGGLFNPPAQVEVPDTLPF